MKINQIADGLNIVFHITEVNNVLFLMKLSKVISHIGKTIRRKIKSYEKKENSFEHSFKFHSMEVTNSEAYIGYNYIKRIKKDVPIQ